MIEKIVKHSDSCFLSKKRLSQLTSICLQLVDNKKQQQQQQQQHQQQKITEATITTTMASADKITLTELKQILSTTGMDCNGLKTHLSEPIKQANLIHRLTNPEAADIPLQKHEELQRGVDAPGGEAKTEATAVETCAEEPAATVEPTAEENGTAVLN